MHILVVSPVASHPQLQGNSARIYRFCRQLQAHGYKIHFLYSQYEGLTPEQKKQMAECWDYFYSLDASMSGIGGKSFDNHFGVDDWYVPNLDNTIRALQNEWDYCAAIVNYVWLSKSLLSLPRSVFKIIDTHDVFGNRHIRSLAVDLEPEWFYTSIDEEVTGLKRADLVIAIQDIETAYFRELGINSKTFGFVTEPRFLPPRRTVEKLSVGYIGSANPWNVKAVNEFAKVVSETSSISRAFNILVGGPICQHVVVPKQFKLLGNVENLSDFYSSVDIIVNPMQGGTGLKIKSVEALSFGRALLSTADGTAGIHSSDPFHKFESVKELVNGLIQLARDRALVEQKIKASRETFISYANDQLTNLGIIVAAIEAHRSCSRHTSVERA